VRVIVPAVTVNVSWPDVFVGVVSDAVAPPPSVPTVPVIMPNGVTLNETLVPSNTGIPAASRTLTVKFVALAQVAAFVAGNSIVAGGPGQTSWY
jgi:hypothetical protein